MREVRETGRFRAKFETLYEGDGQADLLLARLRRFLASHGDRGFVVRDQPQFRGWPMHPAKQSVRVIYRLTEDRLDLVDLVKIPAPGDNDDL